jgi:hypothetical protein
VPEAWKFIPQGRGTPVKLAAEAFIRQAAGLHNYLWLDSQDIAGVEKIILKSVPLWILGVQREANEVKRTLAQIPAGFKKPRPEEIATLGLGEFFVCHGKHITKVYVQPAWMSADEAKAIARGERSIDQAGRRPSSRPTVRDPEVRESKSFAKEDEMNPVQEKKLDEILDFIRRASAQSAANAAANGVADGEGPGVALADEESLYQRFKQRKCWRSTMRWKSPSNARRSRRMKPMRSA